MKKLLFILLTLFPATVVVAKNKLESRPVLFITSYSLYDNVLELKDAEKKYEQNQTESEEEITKKVSKRIAELCEQYAKEMGACAVVDISSVLSELLVLKPYIDPAYDITQRIVDQINKEYLKRKI